MRFPAVMACSTVNGVTSRIGLRVASHASSGVRPRFTSLLCTSARLTVLLVATFSSCGVSFSAPDSRLSTARSAEASRTILFIPGRLAPFGDQLIYQRRTWFHVLADKFLRSLKAAFQRGDPQLVILDPQHDFIPHIDAKSPT